MGDEIESRQFLVVGGIVAQEDAQFVQLYGSRMLHASELVAGKDYETVFAEGLPYARILFKPLDGMGYLAENR